MSKNDPVLSGKKSKILTKHESDGSSVVNNYRGDDETKKTDPGKLQQSIGPAAVCVSQKPIRGSADRTIPRQPGSLSVMNRPLAPNDEGAVKSSAATRHVNPTGGHRLQQGIVKLDNIPFAAGKNRGQQFKKRLFRCIV